MMTVKICNLKDGERGELTTVHIYSCHYRIEEDYLPKIDKRNTQLAFITKYNASVLLVTYCLVTLATDNY